MKKLFLLMALVASGFFYSTCSNDIDLTAEWKDIPIVYGLISPDDSLNYLRVEKAFLDNNISALKIAQNPDSLYYDNITVQIESLDPTHPGTYNLVRVDGNLEGFPRKEGIFATSPNYLYKLEFLNGERFMGGSEYELQINRGDNLDLVTARTTVLNPIEIRRPDDDPSDANPINWVQSGLRVKWEAGKEASHFNVTVFFVIEEKDFTNPDNNRILTLEWKIAENLEGERDNNGDIDMDLRILKNELFSFLSNRLVENGNISRTITSLDILVTGGGLEIGEYINVGNANTGITSTQVIPTYTNLSEGFGIFSSKTSTFQQGYVLHEDTIDSLRNNSLTMDLNFQFN